MPKRLSAKLVLFVTGVLVMGIVSLASAQQPVVIRMYTGSPIGSDPYNIYDRFLRMYEQLNPHVTIENLGQEHNPDKLMTYFLAGEAPDVIEHDAWLIVDYYQRGLLAPLPADMQQVLNDELFPVSVYSVMSGDNMVGVPVESIPLGLWYSKEAMAKGGVTEVPQTLAELERVAKRLSKVQDGQLVEPGIAHSGRDEWTVEHTTLAMLIAEGGRVLDDDGKLVIDSPALYRMGDTLVSWIKGGDFFGFDWGWDSYVKFNQGLVPFGIGYPWWMGDQRTQYPGDYTTNFGVARIPGSTGGFGTVHYGHAYGVNKNSAHKDEVFKLLQWLSTATVDGATPLGHYHAAIGSLPVHKDDIASPLYAAERQVYQGFIENLEVARTVTEWRKFGANPKLNLVVVAAAESDVPFAEGVANMLRTVRADMAAYEASLQK